MRQFICFLFFVRSVILFDSSLLIVERLLRYPEFRYVKVRTSPCTDQMRCTTRSCSVSKYVRDGFIDVLGIKESNTGYSGSNHVWKDIYSKSNSKELTGFISGIHFSVTVHISRNYSQFLWWYLPNPNVYHRRYNKEYKENFDNLFRCVEAAIKSLNNDNIIFRPKKRSLRFFIHYNIFISRLKKTINTNEPQEKYPPMNVKSILKVIDCIDCDKCKLLGNLQFEGLKQALKIIRGEQISTDDLIYLLAFHRKLCQTRKDIIYLETFSESRLYDLVHYTNVLGYFLMTMIFIKLIIFWKRK